MNLKSLIKASIIAVFISIVVVIYTFTLGNRMTRARTLFLEVVDNPELDKAVKLEKLNESIELWYDSEAEELKNFFEN